jgi:predicted Zn-ribbon and HTH transcriptional regulator
MTSELKKQNDTLITEKTKAQAIIRDLTEKISEQQEQISKQAATLSIPTQYTFDRVMGFLKSRSEGKPYCTACLLEFKEIQLDTNRKPAQCPKCGAEYPVQARFILLSP